MKRLILLYFITSGLYSYSQKIDTIIVSSDSCNNCADIYMRFYMDNIFYWPPKNINHIASGNQLQIQTQWDSIFLGCFDIFGYRDTTIKVCNLAEGLNQFDCHSDCWVDKWYIPYSGYEKDSATQNATIHNCFNPFENEQINFCPKDGSLLLKAKPGFASYRWLPGEQTSESIFVDVPGKYSVEAQDWQGNIYSDSIEVKEICSTCFIPNSFTPNGDGKNDVFKPVCLELNEYEFLIYDRWGNKIYGTTNLSEGWDGKIKSQQALQDVYVWMLTTKNVFGDTTIQRGHVLLIK